MEDRLDVLLKKKGKFAVVYLTFALCSNFKITLTDTWLVIDNCDSCIDKWMGIFKPFLRVCCFVKFLFSTLIVLL